MTPDRHERDVDLVAAARDQLQVGEQARVAEVVDERAAEVEMSSPAGVLTVPFGVVDVCQAGTSLTQPQSKVTVPPRFGS